MSDLRQIAEKLGIAATDALVEELPELGSRICQVEEVIRIAVLTKLYAMAEERRRQEQMARLRMRAKRRGPR